MVRRETFLIAIGLLVYALTTAAPGGQCPGNCTGREPMRCKTDNGSDRTFKYKMGLTFRSKRALGGPDVQVMQISIEPKRINQEDLLKVARWLKTDFCKEQRLSVMLLTDRRYADTFPVGGTLWYNEWQDALRGEYFLDRESGEEYISYSTVPNYNKNPQARVKVNLGRNSPSKDK